MRVICCMTLYGVCCYFVFCLWKYVVYYYTCVISEDAYSAKKKTKIIIMHASYSNIPHNISTSTITINTRNSLKYNSHKLAVYMKHRKYNMKCQAAAGAFIILYPKAITLGTTYSMSFYFIESTTNIQLYVLQQKIQLQIYNLQYIIYTR